MGAASSLANGAPYDGAGVGQTLAPTANDFGVISFTGGQAGTETSHQANVVPKHWKGREVGLICTGGICYVAFSQHFDAEVDRTIAATAAGAAVKVGVPLPNSVSVETRMRIPASAEDIYFVRESDTLGTKVYMRLLS